MSVPDDRTAPDRTAPDRTAQAKAVEWGWGSFTALATRWGVGEKPTTAVPVGHWWTVRLLRIHEPLREKKDWRRRRISAHKKGRQFCRSRVCCAWRDTYTTDASSLWCVCARVCKCWPPPFWWPNYWTAACSHRLMQAQTSTQTTKASTKITIKAVEVWFTSPPKHRRKPLGAFLSAFFYVNSDDQEARWNAFLK